MLENLKHTKLDPHLGDIGYLTTTGKKAVGVTGEVMLVDEDGLPIGGLESGGGASSVSGYIGKPSNGDFVTAYAGASTITLSSLPGAITSVTDEDIVSVVQINTSGEVVATYTRDETIMSVAANVLTVSGATFAATDTFVVVTNIPRAESGGAGGAGGGSIVYTNAAGDFIATPTNGAATITITGLPFTLEAIHVMGGSIEKKAVTTNLITQLNPTSISVSGGVITLGGVPNFVTGDEVYVTLIGPDKAYDLSLDTILVTNQNPNYAHTTSPETLISESALPGAKPTADAGGSATRIVDADGAFTAGGTAVGYRAYNVTEGVSALVSAYVSATQIDLGAGATDWSSDVYSLPVIRRYEISADTYNFLTMHYRLTCDASSTAYLKIYGTLDASATVDADTNWVDLSLDIFGVSQITVSPSTTEEDIVTISNPITMLKYMVKLIVEDSEAAASTNVFTMFVKKSS